MSHDANDTDDSETADRTADVGAGPVTVRHTWGQSDRPSLAVVEAVAAVTNRPTTDLPPLQQSLDPDALDTLLTRGPSSLSVTFGYADAAVWASGSGSVEVRVDGRPADGDGG